MVSYGDLKLVARAKCHAKNSTGPPLIKSHISVGYPKTSCLVLFQAHGVIVVANFAAEKAACYQALSIFHIEFRLLQARVKIFALKIAIAKRCMAAVLVASQQTGQLFVLVIHIFVVHCLISTDLRMSDYLHALEVN